MGKHNRKPATTEPEPVNVLTGTEPEPVKTESPEGFLSAFYRMIDVKPLAVPEDEPEPETTPEPVKGFKAPEYITRDKEEEDAKELVARAIAEAVPGVLATIGRRLSAKVEREALDVTLILSAFLTLGWTKVLTAVLLPTVSGGMLEVQFKKGSAWKSASMIDSTEWQGAPRIVGLFPRTKPHASAYGLPDSWLFVNATFNQRHAKPAPVVITLPADVRAKLAAAVK